MRKIYLVPNFITTANMFCGFYSLICTLHRDFIPAAWALVLAGIFDMLDGRIARLAKATSQFGVEYDSLSDLVSFGVAPAILLYQWGLEPYDKVGWFVGFFFMACGALRLARFNVNNTVVPKNYFQGLPIPMAAGMIPTLIIFHHSTGWPEDRGPVGLGLAICLAGLMVSTFRFSSFKEFNWRSRASFGYLMLGVICMALIAIRPDITLFVTLSVYISIGILMNFFRLVFRRNSVELKSE